MKKLPERKPTRLAEYDYNSDGAYFIIICTEDRKQILSRIVGGDVPYKTAFSCTAVCVCL